MSTTKVYLEIIKQLREMITDDGLKPGDKIPSERELSERLNFGRSSVREALRALEMLGLIETRRGEGTFIRDFRDHRLVQLLSTFILQDEKAKTDVFETVELIEIDGLQLALRKMKSKDHEELLNWIRTVDVVRHSDFFYRIIRYADNYLLFRIWVILKEYYESLVPEPAQYSREDYLSLAEALAKRDEAKTLSAYRQLRNLSFK
nr:GntR family transcriptional regulator [Neobacillus dielmonensis]